MVLAPNGCSHRARVAPGPCSEAGRRHLLLPAQNRGQAREPTRCCPFAGSSPAGLGAWPAPLQSAVPPRRGTAGGRAGPAPFPRPRSEPHCDGRADALVDEKGGGEAIPNSSSAQRSQFCHSTPTTEPAGPLQGQVPVVQTAPARPGRGQAPPSPWPRGTRDSLARAWQGLASFSCSSPEDANARPIAPMSTPGSWRDLHIPDQGWQGPLLGHQPGSWARGAGSHAKAAMGHREQEKHEKRKKLQILIRKCTVRERALNLPEGKPAEGAEPRLH